MAFQYNVGVNWDCLALLKAPLKSDLNIICEDVIALRDNADATNFESCDD